MTDHGFPPQALIVGESLVDIVTDKYGLTSLHPGGSAANTAVALARLGRATHLATSFADDGYGALLRKHLSRAGVHWTNNAAAVPHTSSAHARIRADGSADYRFDVQWHVVLPRTMTPVLIHASSLVPVLTPGAHSVLAFLRRLHASTTVSYDINLRPSITGRGPRVTELVEKTASLSDLVKASDEDLRYLYPSSDTASAARRLLTLGARVVVVTRGRKGVTWFARRQRVDVASRPARVVDTIGAGDTFAAALLDGLWSMDLLGAGKLPGIASIGEQAIRELLGWASSAAAVTVSRPGADPPSRSELELLYGTNAVAGARPASS